jgi:hypothetical protein
LTHGPRSKRIPGLQEARRVLTGEGHLLLPMSNPVVGLVSHPIRRRYDRDPRERGLGEEEAKGLWAQEVQALLAARRLRLTETIPFVCGLNCLDVVAQDRTGDHRPSGALLCLAHGPSAPPGTASRRSSRLPSPHNGATARRRSIDRIAGDGAQGLADVCFRGRAIARLSYQHRMNTRGVRYPRTPVSGRGSLWS